MYHIVKQIEDNEVDPSNIESGGPSYIDQDVVIYCTQTNKYLLLTKAYGKIQPNKVIESKCWVR